MKTGATLALLATISQCRPSEKRSACGGIAGLNQCGGFYPDDFCCPASTQCLQVNTSVSAVICCPTGVDCRVLQPTTCDPSAYDASKAPLNQIHVQPVQNLTSCGSACCPPGFDCRNSNCVAVASNATASTSQSAASQTSTSQAQISIVPAVESTKPSFSGTSFAAGFVPGIVLGALVVLILLWLRHRRKSSQSSDKSEITSLYPPVLPPMVSISQPSDAGHHRTDFLRSTSHDSNRHGRGSISTDSPEEYSSAASTDLRPMLNFETVYAQPRSPSPAFLHRALSFRFSPQGKLRNKQSMHSLRRHMDDQAESPSIDRSDSSKSTGTIKVALPPEESPWHAQWSVTRSDTPTRSPSYLQPHALGSPYTPSRYNDSYVEPRRSERRVTTFSSLMEKAGFRRREFEDI